MGVKDEQRAAQRGGGGKQRQGRGRGQSDQEFVNLELNAEQVKEFRAWREDFDGVIDEWGAILNDGYKTSIKYDDYSSSYTAYFFAPEDSDNVGYILSGRGGNPYRALSELVYKHTRILQGEWSQYHSNGKAVDDPDY